VVPDELAVVVRQNLVTTPNGPRGRICFLGHNPTWAHSSVCHCSIEILPIPTATSECAFALAKFFHFREFFAFAVAKIQRNFHLNKTSAHFFRIFLPEESACTSLMMSISWD
jgi:hypothetical protein